jgi:hypothetical protein
MPWYLRVLQPVGELWSELKIELTVHHLPAALIWSIPAALVAVVLSVIVIVKR